MPKQSAGIVLYRERAGAPEVLHEHLVAELIRELEWELTRKGLR